MKANFQLVSSLRHPAIGGLRNLEQDETGAYYLVMDYVDGQSLAEYIHGFVPPLESIFIILESIASALDYAHENGIVHRDIKPDNVKIDAERNIKLLDFGIAVAMTSRRASEAGGTPEYMAPEQWFGEPQSGATDEYALAALAYRMMYGVVPFADIFKREKDLAKEAQTIFMTPVSCPPGTAAEVQAVFAKGLAKESGDRYASCVEFVTELEYATGCRERERPPKKSFLPWIIAGAVLIAAGGVTAYLVNENRKAKANVRVEEREVVHTEVVTNVSKVVETVVDDARIRELEAKLKNSEAARREYETEKAAAEARAKALADAKARADAAAKARDEAERADQEKAEREAKEKAEREAKERAEREAKAAKERAAAPSDEQLIAKGAGFVTARYKLDRQNIETRKNSFKQIFHLWRDKKYTRVVRLDYNNLPEYEIVAYGTFMKMKGGVRYDFATCYDDFALLAIDDSMIIRQIEQMCRFDLQSFTPKRDGWYRITAAFGNFGLGGGPRSGIGILYREDDGEWKNFDFTMDNRVFRVNPPGRLPSAMEARDELALSRALLKPDTVLSEISAKSGKGSRGLIHRWSFSGNLKDSVGGADAKAVGGDVSFENKSVRITPQSGYVDLGADVIPNRDGEFTIEIWATQHSINNWSRVFQIPDSWGDNDFFWAWNAGTDARKWGWKVAGYGLWYKVKGDGLCPGKEHHFVVRYFKNKEGRGAFIVHVFRGEDCYWWRGEQLNGTMFTSHKAFWLGKSPFADNSQADASYDEVRIWNRSLSDLEVQLSAILGPDRLP